MTLVLLIWKFQTVILKIDIALSLQSGKLIGELFLDAMEKKLSKAIKIMWTTICLENGAVPSEHIAMAILMMLSMALNMASPLAHT